MTIREGLNGIYTRADLDRLTWPIAWSGTVSTEQRAEQEAALFEVVSEGKACLDESPDLYAVEVKDGKILWTLTYEQFEKESNR